VVGVCVVGFAGDGGVACANTAILLASNTAAKIAQGSVDFIQFSSQ
jgi:hypothetical protein